MNFVIKGNVVDIEARAIRYAAVHVADGKIVAIDEIEGQREKVPFVLPGFIDAHVHIESSMLVPSEFAKLAVLHGTVATVSDPHEIANVCGLPGIEYMIANGAQVPFKFYFGTPSCVPATIFETAGSAVTALEVDALLAREDIHYLSEMMNFPGVLQKDKEVMEKIASAKKVGKPVDGHAPGLRGVQAAAYIAAGISTDHECFTRDEALDKLHCGMKILIREGSAAKNFDALIDLLPDHENEIMFCSDDKHPDSLIRGHINEHCQRAVARGIDIFKILKAACVNPVKHYHLGVGNLHLGDAADFILVRDLQRFEVLATYIDGQQVAEGGISKIRSPKAGLINNFHCSKRTVEDFIFLANEAQKMVAIEALDGQLITNKFGFQPKVARRSVAAAAGEGSREIDCYVSDVENDLLKIAVVNRYIDAPVALGFVKNFGLTRGALASSVAHDSHNIIAVGVDDESLCRAVNLIIGHKGGVSCVDGIEGKSDQIIPLPVAGLMSNEDGTTVAAMYTAIDQMAKACGSTLSAPFMTLSFMALLVIPHIKMSDGGLFDGDTFQFIN